jgi:osmotically-inducible protein OsmY
LSGFVDSAEYVTRAGEVAGHVQGVKEVKNDLIAK